MTEDTLAGRIARFREQFALAERAGLKITPVEIESDSLIYECQKRITDQAAHLELLNETGTLFPHTKFDPFRGGAIKCFNGGRQDDEVATQQEAKPYDRSRQG